MQSGKPPREILYDFLDEVYQKLEYWLGPDNFELIPYWNRVFVSHTSHDKDYIMDRLIPPIERIVKGSWSASSIFCLDYSFGILGMGYGQMVGGALLSSASMVIVLSKTIMDSEWCKAEIDWILENKKDRTTCILVEPLDPTLIHEEIPHLPCFSLFSGDASEMEAFLTQLSQWREDQKALWERELAEKKVKLPRFGLRDVLVKTNSGDLLLYTLTHHVYQKPVMLYSEVISPLLCKNCGRPAQDSSFYCSCGTEYAMPTSCPHCGNEIKGLLTGRCEFCGGKF